MIGKFPKKITGEYEIIYWWLRTSLSVRLLKDLYEIKDSELLQKLK